MSTAGVWFVRGIGKQSQLYGRPVPISSPGPTPDLSANLSTSSPPQIHGPQHPLSPAVPASSPPPFSFSPSPSPRPQESLYELHGVLDLIVLSYLIDLTPTTDTGPNHTHECTHESCPATCPLCIDKNYKLWGEREHLLSQDGKTYRQAQKDAAVLSTVCKRWHCHVRQPKQNKLLWTRLALRVGTASNSLAASIVSSYGRFISTVDLSNQKMLSDEAVNTMLVACGGLKALSIKRCGKVTGSCFSLEDGEGVAKEIPKLSNLTLAGLENLKDSCLTAIGRLFGRSLETVNLSGNKQLTGKGVKSLVKHCEVIVSLDLCNTSELTQAHLRYMLRKGVRSLKSINIGGCLAIGDDFVKSIMADESHDTLIYRR